MKPARHRRFVPVAVVVCLSVVVSLCWVTSRAILHPSTDDPGSVDAIVVVAGAFDERYDHAVELAVRDLVPTVLVSRPSKMWSVTAALVDGTCDSSPISSPNDHQVEIECFTPDSDTTEGETTAATRIARERGWKSILVITYWGHVSRVRIYFNQCFAGAVYVTDTPNRLSKSRKDALLHETGGYVKALLKPAC